MASPSPTPPADRPPAIVVHGLTKRFGDVVAVDDISFQVPHGAVTGLLGGNGAGKTTTIAILLGLMTRTLGHISILGHDLDTGRYAALARMNFSSPYVDLPHRLTVRENLMVYGKLYGVQGVRQRIQTLAEELDLGDLLGRQTGTLSAGQKTRVTLAKALINRPDLLLLDEPTASLDPDTADHVRGHLERVCRDSGTAILLASHNMGEVERLCSSVLMMRRGQIVDRGTPADLLDRYGRQSLEQVFLDIAREPAASATASRPEAAE